jgi:hypothetical protein
MGLSARSTTRSYLLGSVSWARAQHTRLHGVVFCAICLAPLAINASGLLGRQPAKSGSSLRQRSQAGCQVRTARAESIIPCLLLVEGAIASQIGKVCHGVSGQSRPVLRVICELWDQTWAKPSTPLGYSSTTAWSPISANRGRGRGRGPGCPRPGSESESLCDSRGPGWRWQWAVDPGPEPGAGGPAAEVRVDWRLGRPGGGLVAHRHSAGAQWGLGWARRGRAGVHTAAAPGRAIPPAAAC